MSTALKAVRKDLTNSFSCVVIRGTPAVTAAGYRMDVAVTKQEDLTPTPERSVKAYTGSQGWMASMII
ncbi:hypothetical protein GCM10009425_46600 [Pseudomonas asuensis]|uniref:Uncharacterized protein n=1 Tax=Pseudomonas asuensis TaxID=1825787 RepID=A0ABQ2H311_9PSED|nr:hypothetical protein GCM10009425_46600 [Pseudomonas asuensis]